MKSDLPSLLVRVTGAGTVGRAGASLAKYSVCCCLLSNKHKDQIFQSTQRVSVSSNTSVHTALAGSGRHSGNKIPFATLRESVLLLVKFPPVNSCAATRPALPAWADCEVSYLFIFCFILSGGERTGRLTCKLNQSASQTALLLLSSPAKPAANRTGRRCCCRLAAP